MEIFKLSQMTKGWFVGDFEPSVIKTEKCEVGVKLYKKGAQEKAHFHKEAKEITVIIKGKAKINDTILSEGDIILIDTNETAQFEALEDVITVVYKSSSVSGDKYLVNDK
jgi:quercetin dioxygenase-like cupin family protein